MSHAPVHFGWLDDKATPAHAYLMPRIRELMPQVNGLRVLDLGSGNGYMAAQLAKHHRVTGIDHAEDGIALARRACPTAEFHLMSVYDDLSCITPENGYDVVVCCEVIEHLYSPKRLLDNAFATLRPGGLLILSTPYHGYFKNLALSLLDGWDRHFHVEDEGGHIKFFSQKSLKRMLLDTGFEDVSFCNVGRLPLLWKSIVCRAVKPKS